jgi:hypothetical protein
MTWRGQAGGKCSDERIELSLTKALCLSRLGPQRRNFYFVYKLTIEVLGRAGNRSQLWLGRIVQFGFRGTAVPPIQALQFRIQSSMLLPCRLAANSAWLRHLQFELFYRVATTSV